MRWNDLKARTRELLGSASIPVYKTGLAAVLIALGAATAGATVIVTPDTATVTGVVSGGPPINTYSYTVNNTSPVSSPNVTEFELPLISMASINPGSIVTPGGWTATILTSGWSYNTSSDPSFVNNPTKYGSNPQFYNTDQVILEFSTTGAGIGPGSSLSGFSFTSNLGPVPAPALVYFSSTPVDADPPVPGAVPEPASMVMFGTAVLMLAAACGYQKIRTRLCA